MKVFNRLAALLYVFSRALAIRDEHGPPNRPVHQREAAGSGQDLGGLAAKILDDVCLQEDDIMYVTKEKKNEAKEGLSNCMEPKLVFGENYPWSASDEFIFEDVYSGKVWRGRCDGKSVVVKAQKATPSARCEASLMEKGLSPHMVRAFAANSTKDCTYIVMEYTNHRTLTDYIDDPHFRVGDLEMGRFFYESLLALQELHKAGVVHRDLEFDKIFITSGREDLGYLRAKIGEFGHACYYKKIHEKDEGYDDPCRRCYGHEGSPIYMSPSYAAARAYNDDDKVLVTDFFPADDLWSMGKILLQIVHGTKEEVKVDLEKEVISECRQKGGTVDLYKLRAALVGKDLVSLKMKNSAPLLWRPELQELLSFLLCSGCDHHVGKGPEATEKAIALTKKWLENDRHWWLKERVGKIGLASVPKMANECLQLTFKSTIIEFDGRGQELGRLAAKIPDDVCVPEQAKEGERCEPYECQKPSEAFVKNYPWSASEEDVLGSGCFGTVWRGRCAEEPVVVKAQKATSSALCEATVVMKNLSPFLARAFATASTWDCAYTVMEYANEGTLADYIDKTPGSAESEMGQIFYECLLGLQELHNRSLVHRDLKPDNIFITSSRDDSGRLQLHPKIGDFGLACYYKKIHENTHDRVADYCRRCDNIEGTAIYMSPSYFNAPEYRDQGDYVIDIFPADDLWSMGKILLQIVHRTKEDIKVDLEEAAILKCTHKNKAVDNSEMCRTLVGKDLVSENMKNSAPLLGKPRLQELLSFLLCSGCDDPVGKGPEATEKAIALTKTWLEEELNLSQERMDKIGLSSVAEISPECHALTVLDN